MKPLSAALVPCLFAGGAAGVATAHGLPGVGRSATIANAQGSPQRVHDYWSGGCDYVHTCLRWSHGYCRRWGRVKSCCH